MHRDRFARFGSHGLSRRGVLRGAGATAAGLALGNRFEHGYAKVQTPTTRNIQGTSLKLLQWEHFVPAHDEWFEGFVQEWGDANGVEVTLDRINTAEVTTTFAAEISAGEGHDIVEHIASLGQFEGSLLDMTDVVQEAMNRHGEMSGV